MFEALQAALPRHRVYISDVRPPWRRSEDDEGFHCPACFVDMTGEELRNDFRHIYIDQPTQEWPQADCTQCGQYTWPKIENRQLCGLCLQAKK